ncbi:hypothetical protein IQ222_09210, partial [Dolichospermum flos-aquae LEGE 04289]|nr:hypothetical protein [Dolichospermum flos-aquae LEGE 04289]
VTGDGCYATGTGNRGRVLRHGDRGQGTGATPRGQVTGNRGQKLTTHYPLPITF